MILITDLDGAPAFADILRSADIPVIIRCKESITEDELSYVSAAVSRSAAKLKNMMDDLTVYTFGDGDIPPFSDGHARNPSELISFIKTMSHTENNLLFFGGAAVHISCAFAEHNGKTVTFSKSEMRILKCIISSTIPLPAHTVAEACFGKEDPRSVMTLVFRINKKFSSLASKKLIMRAKQGGYFIE